ncbi:hypothetical protein [Pseudomonas putida]|uniref:hypothetical protein n=1 Tax=Pseudomonas putida TaxID=303 RepID=UPI0008197085|nr:hypothetical protein [Pseudomonas putida]OCT28058.1 hypothetical protein A6E23_10150 [Pseudomonas putida]OCT32556.1 hypothetical protein A6E20_02935 [Pseudomonas putida]OCT36693.1 hypothetical protein A6E24_20880 [Pseudomonas putida]OCT38571.1 hypothetical protein A6E19_09565 [Pseudomonas putida]
MPKANNISEYLHSKGVLSKVFFNRVEHVTVWTNTFGQMFELATDKGAVYVNNPDQQQQLALYGLMAKLDATGKPVKVDGGVEGTGFDFLTYPLPE